MNSEQYITAVERREKMLYEQMAPYRVNLPEGKSGKWTVSKFNIECDISMLRFLRDGRSPGLGEFTRLSCEGRGVVMSDTNAEIYDLLPYLQDFKGNVLISGLGLGMAIQALLQDCPLVETITVIEAEKDVIKLCGKPYEDQGVRIIHADAYTWELDQRFDCAWHDIWDNICSDNKPLFTKIKRHYQKAVPAGMQFCWGQAALKNSRYA